MSLYSGSAACPFQIPEEITVRLQYQHILGLIEAFLVGSQTTVETEEFLILIVGLCVNRGSLGIPFTAGTLGLAV